MREVILLNKSILAIGITILFILSALAPLSLGYNVKVFDTIEPPSTLNHGITLYVGGDGPGNYSSIQDAINDSSDGDTVFVYNGTYYEKVRIDKSINLIGEDKNTTIIDGYSFITPVAISADNVVFCGFTVQNSGFFLNGITVSNWNQIFGNIIRNNGKGINLGGSNNTIWDNKIIYNNFDGIFIDDKNKYMDDNLITRNFIAHNRGYGILDIDRDGETTATWNVIADNGKVFKHSGLYKQDSYSVYHHNDFFFNYRNAAADSARYGNVWDDGSEGNFWNDWEENEGYPNVYVISREFSDEIDYHPSTTPYMDSLVVGLSYPYYGLVNEPIDFSPDFYVMDIYSVSWFWDFGDGNTSYESNPNYSYASTGLYVLNVTVTDNQGRSDRSASRVYIGRSPEKPTIKGPTSGKRYIIYNYTITTVDPDGDDVYYDIRWGYEYGEELIGPYSSGEEVNVNHSWTSEKTYTIRIRAHDTAYLWSEWETLEVVIPRDRILSNTLFMRFLELFPILEKIILRLQIMLK